MLRKGIWANFGLGNDIYTPPPSGPSCEILQSDPDDSARQRSVWCLRVVVTGGMGGEQKFKLSISHTDV